MKLQKWIKFKPKKDLISVIIFSITIWILNLISSYFHGTMLFYFFYQGLFAYVGCILLPLLWTKTVNKKSLNTIGISTQNAKKAIFIGIIISVLSILGRLKNIDLNIKNQPHLYYIIIAMIFSSLYEEIFFRGFIQTTIESSFGIIPAVLLSGLCFSLYHSAMNFIGFNINILLNLFLIGVFFSISFRITNNIITSYIVNLPHAIITFYEKPQFIEYGKSIDIKSAIFCILSIIITILTIIIIEKRNKKICYDTLWKDIKNKLIK